MKRTATYCAGKPGVRRQFRRECGKISFCMNTSSDINIEKPKIIQALLAGFNTIANKPYLIILPILLDLFLWFGPGWRVDNVFKPVIDSLQTFPGLDTTEYANIIGDLQISWQELLANFNLAVILRTFPIGVPSLMASKTPFINPLGHTTVTFLNTDGQVLWLTLLFLALGITLGNLYMQKISQQVMQNDQKTDIKTFLKSLIQAILMPVALSIILLLICIPVLFILGLVMMISPAVSQFLTSLALLVIIWVLLPLIFTPHGIFLYKQNLIAAMMTSISVVRMSMAKTAWFILASYVIVEGLDYLWRSPGTDNWFLLVGILGHAFIVSAIIAASFHYFIDATKFSQTVMNKQLQANQASSLNDQD